MTLTTRTTRKAPWAVALTALLGVLSLVFGLMAVAGVANAYVGTDKPDDPGNSQNAPGHEVTPPGHQDDGTPGNSGGTDTAKKVWICHADVNNNGDAGLADGKGGEYGIGFNVIHISANAADNAHFKLHPMDQGPFTTEAEAYATCLPQPPKCPAGTDKAGTELATPYVPGEVPDRCDIPDPTGVTATAEYRETLCMYTVLTPSVLIAPMYTTPEYTTQEAANADAAAYWTAERKAGALATFLGANAAYTMPTMTDTGLVCITPEQAAAIDAALAEPATVAPVLPGTVEEPEAVAVPAPATVPPLPATIPAGDGSGTPTVPTALLALLVLGATALAASTVRLVRTTR